MAKFDVLDHIQHANLKVQMRFGEEHGSNLNQVVVFPTEFQELQREYPIFFRKADDGQYYAVAILGLDKDENLFLDSDEQRWTARHIPAVQLRGPFALELKDTPSGSAESEDPVVRIDMDDARVNEEEGESIFLPYGGYSPFFEEMLLVLRRIHVGASVSSSFFGKLESFGLIEPVTVQAKLSETKQYTVPDVFTISKARMVDLAANELHELNQLSLLEHCYAVLSSAGNMTRLVEMKALKSVAAN